MKITALCHDCNHYHPIDFDPQAGPGAAFSDWMQKHPLHDIDFLWPGRRRSADVANSHRLMEMIPNADVKLSYAASAAYTISLASLATSSTLLAGRESTGILNTTNLYFDYIVGGKVQTGTTPTVNKTIQVIAIGSVDGTPTYPDVFDGTDSAETITNADIKNSIARYVASMNVAATSNVDYWFGPVSLAALFGTVPRAHVLFVTHDTAVNLNATGGNHVLSHNGVFATVI